MHFTKSFFRGELRKKRNVVRRRTNVTRKMPHEKRLNVNKRKKK